MNEIITHRLEFTGVCDMNLTHVFECGQCFRWTAGDDGSYTGVAGQYFCRALLTGTTLVLDVSGGDREFWYDYFDLGTDYGRIKRTIGAADKGIAAAVEHCYGIRILQQDFYEVLISFIISQNNNIPRIKACIEAMCREYGKEIGCRGGIEYYAFPEAELLAELSHESFASLKFGYRSDYLPKASRRFLERGKPRGTAEEKRRELLEYTGIGPKVANCIMLFGLGEVSAFPIDTWVRTFMSDLYGFAKDDIKGMEKYAKEHFGKYGGYIQQYLFYYYRG